MCHGEYYVCQHLNIHNFKFSGGREEQVLPLFYNGCSAVKNIQYTTCHLPKSRFVIEGWIRTTVRASCFGVLCSIRIEQFGVADPLRVDFLHQIDELLHRVTARRTAQSVPGVPLSTFGSLCNPWL